MFQWLKFPITETLRAFGAHTLNEVPRSPLNEARVRTQLVVSAIVSAFVEQVEIVSRKKADIVTHGRVFFVVISCALTGECSHMLDCYSF